MLTRQFTPPWLGKARPWTWEFKKWRREGLVDRDGMQISQGRGRDCLHIEIIRPHEQMPLPPKRTWPYGKMRVVRKDLPLHKFGCTETAKHMRFDAAKVLSPPRR